MKIDNNQPIELATLIEAADTAFEGYDFGEGVTVADSDSWNNDDPLDLTKIVYVNFDESLDADSEKVSFHVRFDSNGQVLEVYALLISNGDYIGHNGRTETNLLSHPKL